MELWLRTGRKEPVFRVDFGVANMERIGEEERDALRNSEKW